MNNIFEYIFVKIVSRNFPFWIRLSPKQVILWSISNTETESTSIKVIP
jgi:hypothetical protein